MEELEVEGSVLKEVLPEGVTSKLRRGGESYAKTAVQAP